MIHHTSSGTNLMGMAAKRRSGAALRDLTVAAMSLGLLTLLSLAPAQCRAQQNILLIIADDYGADVMGLYSGGTTAPSIADNSGSASRCEIGRTGILVRVGASSMSRRRARFVAPIPGVKTSPG